MFDYKSRMKEYYKQFFEDFLKNHHLMENPQKNMHCLDPQHEE